MTFISFNPGTMADLIANMRDLGDSVDIVRQKIRDASSMNFDPVPGVEESTDPAWAAWNLDSLGQCAVALHEQAEFLSTRRNQVVEMNDNGVLTAAPDGTVSYYLPDLDSDQDPATWDTAANIDLYNTQAAATAQAQAEELKDANNNNGTSPATGRTIDEILADIDTNCDNPVYGAAFIKAFGGVSEYLDFTFGIVRANSTSNQYDGALSTLSHVFAAATQADDGRNGVALAHEVSTVVDDSTHTPGRLAAFNTLLCVSDAVYGTEFLLDLGSKFECRKPDAMASGYGYDDPMYGVLTAMGNNPKAALAFLVPDGQLSADGRSWIPGQVSTGQWDLLTSSDWNAEHPGCSEALAAATAGASAMRVLTPESTDEQAAWITGQAMTHFASQDRSSITPKTKNYIAILLGNCMPEVEDTVLLTHDASGAEHNSWEGKEPPPLPGDHSNDIKTLTEVVGTDDTALAALCNAAGQYSGRRIDTILQEYPNSKVPPTDPGDPMSLEIANAARSDGMVLGFIEQSALNVRAKNASEEGAARGAISTTLLTGLSSGLSEIPHPVAQGTGVGLTIASSVLTMGASDPGIEAVSDADALSSAARQQVYQGIMVRLSNDHRLPAEGYIDYNDTDYATVYAWMDSNHHIDFDMVRSNSTYQQEFNSWLTDSSIPSASLLTDFGGGVTDGRNAAPRH